MEKKYSYTGYISYVCANIPLKLVSSIFYSLPKERISKIMSNTLHFI